MRISDWSSDVCSSDLYDIRHAARPEFSPRHLLALAGEKSRKLHSGRFFFLRPHRRERSEEHTSELQSLMRISYAVFCLKKKIHTFKLFTPTLVNIQNQMTYIL